MGIGSRVEAYPPGKVEDKEALLFCAEISAGSGYASCQPPILHMGLGSVDAVDLKVVFPHGKGTIIEKDVPVNRRIVVKGR